MTCGWCGNSASAGDCKDDMACAQRMAESVADPVKQLRRELDEARTELFRLRESLRWADRARMASARQAAERQREECALAFEREEADDVDAWAAGRVRRVPLVTEEP